MATDDVASRAIERAIALLQHADPESALKVLQDTLHQGSRSEAASVVEARASSYVDTDDSFGCSDGTDDASCGDSEDDVSMSWTVDVLAAPGAIPSPVSFEAASLSASEGECEPHAFVARARRAPLTRSCGPSPHPSMSRRRLMLSRAGPVPSQGSLRVSDPIGRGPPHPGARQGQPGTAAHDFSSSTMRSTWAPPLDACVAVSRMSPDAKEAHKGALLRRKGPPTCDGMQTWDNADLRVKECIAKLEEWRGVALGAYDHELPLAEKSKLVRHVRALRTLLRSFAPARDYYAPEPPEPPNDLAALARLIKRVHSAAKHYPLYCRQRRELCAPLEATHAYIHSGCLQDPPLVRRELAWPLMDASTVDVLPEESESIACLRSIATRRARILARFTLQQCIHRVVVTAWKQRTACIWLHGMELQVWRSPYAGDRAEHRVSLFDVLSMQFAMEPHQASDRAWAADSGPRGVGGSGSGGSREQVGTRDSLRSDTSSDSDSGYASSASDQGIGRSTITTSDVGVGEEGEGATTARTLTLSSRAHRYQFRFGSWWEMVHFALVIAGLLQGMGRSHTVLDETLQSVLLAKLYRHPFTAECRIVSSHGEQWMYDGHGRITNLEGMDTECTWVWDGAMLMPLSSAGLAWGHGVWNGVWLRWIEPAQGSDALWFLWHEEVSAFLTSNSDLEWQWTQERRRLWQPAKATDPEVEWTWEGPGRVPACLLMLLQSLRLYRIGVFALGPVHQVLQSSQQRHRQP